MPKRNRKDFYDDCLMQMADEHPDWDEDQIAEACDLMWQGESTNGGVVIKTHASTEPGLEFILSDSSVDRYGDVVEATGWELKNFKQNPIALFNHNKDFPVGKWENLRVVGDALRGHLRLAPEGTSARIDEIRKLIEAGILKAVSVGFLPLESKPRGKDARGEVYTKSELVETSLVAIPANPNALAVAKGLGISDATISSLFAKNGDEKGKAVKSRQLDGKHAKTSPTLSKNMSPLAKRIEDAQARIVKLRDQLTEHMKTVDDENPDDAMQAITEELTTKITAQEKALEGLKRAEAHLAATTVEPTIENKEGGTLSVVTSQRPFAVPAKKVKPSDYIWRSLVVALKHHNEQYKRPILDVLKETYGEDEGTRTVMGMVTRAATVPASTTVTHWATDLVNTAVAEFMETLVPVSIYGGLAAKGNTFTFGRNGIVSIPSRAASPTLAGGFVLQGAPIPVKQAAFAAISLTPKKVAVITTMTREITEHSTPAIEGLLRQAIIDDTAAAIDAVLLDATAASATRPAGLKNGVAKVTATAGGGMASLIGDLKGLTAALITATSGRLRTPVWVLSPGDVLAISLTQAAAGGDLPFRDELARGTLLGFPVIQSTSMTADTFFLLDAADFVTATGDTPNFNISDQAVVHFDDTTPLDITTAAVAATTKSLWQTDSIGIRMTMDMNWAMRRTGCVQWCDTMLWN